MCPPQVSVPVTRYEMTVSVLATFVWCPHLLSCSTSNLGEGISLVACMEVGRAQGDPPVYEIFFSGLSCECMMFIKGWLIVASHCRVWLYYKETRGICKFKMFATATLLLVSVIATESSPLTCMYQWAFVSNLIMYSCFCLIYVLVHHI